MSIKILFLKFLPSPLLPSQLSPLERAERGEGREGEGNLQLRWHDISGCTLSERSERGRDILNKFFQRRLTTANERRKPWIRESGVRKKMELIVQLFSPVDFFFFFFLLYGLKNVSTFQLSISKFSSISPFFGQQHRKYNLLKNILSGMDSRIWIREDNAAMWICKWILKKKKKKKSTPIYIHFEYRSYAS